MWRGVLLLATTLPALTGRQWWCVEGEVVSVGGGAGDDGARPRFGGGERTAVVVARGQRADLACTLHNLHDKTVSWVRSRDLQIVCHDGASFTADARVSCSGGHDDGGAAAARGGELHALHVDRARPDDSGLYECQINTEPKMSLFYNLTVLDEVVPRVLVEGVEALVGGRVGGAATVACRARYEPAPRLLVVPALHVTWSRSAGVERALHVRGGLSLESEAVGARVTSRLTLTELRHEDAGRYTCTVAAPAPAPAPSDTRNVSATVTLHVTDDDDDDGLHAPPPLEAMQRDEGHEHASCTRALPPHLALVVLLLVPLAPLTR